MHDSDLPRLNDEGSHVAARTQDRAVNLVNGELRGDPEAVDLDDFPPAGRVEQDIERAVEPLDVDRLPFELACAERERHEA